MNSKNYGKVFFISVLLILSIIRVFPDLVIADDHKKTKDIIKDMKIIKNIMMITITRDVGSKKIMKGMKQQVKSLHDSLWLQI